MPQVIQHNFTPGTIILDEDGDTCRVIGPGEEPDTLEVMYVRPDGQDGFEYDVEIPTIKSVVSTPETAKPDQSPEQKYNEALATFAKDNDAVLTFGYAKGKSKPVEQRRVEPETIYHNKGRTIIVGNDPDRDDVRAFRLDRICGRAHV